MLDSLTHHMGHHTLLHHIPSRKNNKQNLLHLKGRDISFGACSMFCYMLLVWYWKLFTIHMLIYEIGSAYFDYTLDTDI